MEDITSFTGEYAFLSNFSRVPGGIGGHGYCFPTIEHAYQAAKTEDYLERDRIERTRTPAEAKRLGRTVTLRSDWNEVRVDVMRRLLRQKFSDEPLRSQLLATGDRQLIEGNWWGDTFWGVCNGNGENMLGVLLMALRAELASYVE